jgi:hypothetical protein
LEKIDTNLGHGAVVFIPKGAIRHPERALRHAKYLGMKSLIPLIQRGAEVFDKPYRHALRVWNQARKKSDSYRTSGIDDYFIPICNVERYLRKDHHDMVFNTTAFYGNQEVRRVYSWKEGTIGPLNLLENIAGARLRLLAMTRYPFPRPDLLKDGHRGRGSKRNSSRVYAYGTTKGKTTVTITHPFLPELDFADMVRGHLVELCRQCFIYAVPVDAAQHYIDLLLRRLRPFLDRLYIGAIQPSRNRLGSGGFTQKADVILDEIIHHMRGEYGSRSSYPARVTEQIQSEEEFSFKKHPLLELITEREVLDRLSSVLTDTDATLFSERVHSISGRVGTRTHKRSAWGICSPWSTQGIVHGGDYLAEDRSGYLHAAEVPVYGGRGKIDHGLFIRRQPSPTLGSSNQGAGSWFPSIVLDLKAKSAFNFGVRERGETASVDFVITRRHLTDEEWEQMLRNSP